MAPQSDKLASEIRALPEEEKFRLLDVILTDLDKPDPEIDRVWADEARKRWVAYKAGRFQTVSYEELSVLIDESTSRSTFEAIVFSASALALSSAGFADQTKYMSRFTESFSNPVFTLRVLSRDKYNQTKRPLHLTYTERKRNVEVEPSPAYSALSSSGIFQST